MQIKCVRSSVCSNILYWFILIFPSCVHCANLNLKLNCTDIHGGVYVVDKCEYQTLEIASLVPFENHPFEIYTGQRFADMVESIRANGVINPIVVRPLENEIGKYEILSVHNRVEASRKADIKTIPAVVRGGLSDDEALLIVTETNLIQRSFADMKHSERAVAIHTYFTAMGKKQGYRSDLLKDIHDLTSSPVAKKLKLRSTNMDKTGENYGLSKDTIHRYLRIHVLFAGLKEKLDSGEIAIRTAVTLSYLRKDEQEIVAKLLADGFNVSMGQAEKLRRESEKGELGVACIKGILSEVKSSKDSTSTSVKFKNEVLSQYFTDGETADEIAVVVEKALKMYFTQQTS